MKLDPRIEDVLVTERFESHISSVVVTANMVDDADPTFSQHIEDGVGRQ